MIVLSWPSGINAAVEVHAAVCSMPTATQEGHLTCGLDPGDIPPESKKNAQAAFVRTILVRFQICFEHWITYQIRKSFTKNHLSKFIINEITVILVQSVGGGACQRLKIRKLALEALVHFRFLIERYRWKDHIF